MAPPLYEVKTLQHAYAGQPVLAIEHLKIRPAAIVGLLGPNGSGKSTLLKLLGLIERPAQGEIRFNGQVVEPFAEKARFLITMLPQEPFLMKRSVFNNVASGLKLRGIATGVAPRVNEALALVGLTDKGFANRPWYALSGGETQRVALAARLVLEPRVLLLDEPTANVDAASAQLIRKASLRARQKWGTTLIVASHDWQWAYDICDEVLHLFNGHIFGAGHENIVFGPWEELNAGQWGKRLSDGQQIVVTAPPNDQAAAIIGQLTVSEDTSSKGADVHTLRGDVTRLNLARNSGHLLATVLVGDQTFTLQQRHDLATKQALYPGKTICMHYRPSQIQWL
jgi:tungstate transport system ATP-binding protein